MLLFQRFTRTCVTLLLFCSTVALAGNVSLPHTFLANTPARAIEVNANFDAVSTAVNDSATEIAALQTTSANLQTSIALLNSTVASQQATIDNLNSTVASLNTTVVGQQITIDNQ